MQQCLFVFVFRYIDCIRAEQRLGGGSVQAMELALLAILGHRSAHSLATGPVMADPFISPLLFTITPALSWHQASYHDMALLLLLLRHEIFTTQITSKYRNWPSFLLKVFLCLIMTAGITFFRSSGFPFFTVARTWGTEEQSMK